MQQTCFVILTHNPVRHTESTHESAACFLSLFLFSFSSLMQPWSRGGQSTKRDIVSLRHVPTVHTLSEQLLAVRGEKCAVMWCSKCFWFPSVGTLFYVCLSWLSCTCERGVALELSFSKRLLYLRAVAKKKADAYHTQHQYCWQVERPKAPLETNNTITDLSPLPISPTLLLFSKSQFDSAAARPCLNFETLFAGFAGHRTSPGTLNSAFSDRQIALPSVFNVLHPPCRRWWKCAGCSALSPTCVLLPITGSVTCLLLPLSTCVSVSEN